MTTLFNLGSVSSMQIPADWRPGRIISEERPGQVSQPYHFEGDSDITFATYYRGKAMPKLIGQYFKILLEKPAHKVIDDDEYETLYIVLRHMCEEQFFRIDELYTQAINGKMALFVCGLWLSTELRNLGIFMAANLDCTEVDELHYFAPQARFDEHLPAVQAIVQSIRFRAYAERGATNA